MPLIAKKLLYHPMRLLDFLLQVLLPVRRNQVCYVSHPDYSDSAYYMYRHLLEARDNIEHVWLLSDQAYAARVQRDFDRYVTQTGRHGHRLSLAPKYSLKGYFLFLTSLCIFHTHSGYPFSRTAVRRHNVSLWHGMPIKCVGRLNRTSPNPFATFGSMHLATSHFFKYIVAAAFGVPAESVLVGGLPRCDALQFSSKLATPREQIRKLLAVPETNRLVLWMPTFRTEALPSEIGRINVRSFLDDLPAWVLTELDRISAAHGCTTIIKLHPGDLLNHLDTPVSTASVRLLKAADWQKFEIPLYDLLAASDALISDVSSVLIDYLATHRPIGVLGFDPATYTRQLAFPMTHLLNSRRFRALTDPDAVTEFYADTASDRPAADAPDDIAALLYEPLAEKSAEAVLRAVGL